MPEYLLVNCQCGRSVRAAAKDAGSVVRCWDCGGEVRVSHRPTIGDIARGFEDAVRSVFQIRTLAGVLGLAVVATAAVAVPQAGPWLAFGLLAAAGWWYQAEIRDSGAEVSGGGVERETAVRGGRGALVCLALAVLGAAAMVAPFLVRNDGHALPPRSYAPGFRPWMVPTMLGWLVAPLILLAANARDRRGPIPARRALSGLARHPVATLTALLLVPLSCCLLEALLALIVWQQGCLALMIDDLFVTPREVLQTDGTYLIYRFHGTVITRPLGDRSADIAPVYHAALRRGFTLLGTIPASLSTGWYSRASLYAYRTDEAFYAAMRAVLSVLTLSTLGAVLALQARWLGLVAAFGSPTSAVFAPRPVPASSLALATAPRTPLVLDPKPAVAESPRPLPEIRPPIAHGGPLAGAAGQALPTILIIDDERPFAEALGRLLESRGFSVVHAPDATTGLHFARAHQPALILLDLMLPDLPGLEACRVLRDGDQTRSIPIVITTYKSGADDEVAGLNAGADDFIVKPYVIDVLVARIQTQLRKRPASVR